MNLYDGQVWTADDFSRRRWRSTCPFDCESNPMISPLKAHMLLAECTGRDIWSVATCRAKGVPEAWIAELAQAFESGFNHDRETIYYEDRVTNQFHGVHDLQLARKLAAVLGVNVDRVKGMSPSNTAEVRALQEEAEE